MLTANDARISAITHALLDAETALAAIEQLQGCSANVAVIEALVEAIHEPPSARAAVRAVAVASRSGAGHAIVNDALLHALGSEHVTVRLAALDGLRQLRAGGVLRPLLQVLKNDDSWMVRRAALQNLARLADPDRWAIFAAADDPHWRVRHALLQELLAWDAPKRPEIEARLQSAYPDMRMQGLSEYLRFRWAGAADGPIVHPPVQAQAGPEQACPFWDWDPAVLARDLERMGEPGRKQALDVMPFLLGHEDSRVQKLALETLRRFGQAKQIAEVPRLLDDPRRGSHHAARQLFTILDLDRLEAAARLILHMPAATPSQLAWALDQAEVVFPAQEEEARLLEIVGAEVDVCQAPPVRGALARLCGRWPHPIMRRRLPGFLTDADDDVRLAAACAWSQADGGSVDEASLHALLQSADSRLRGQGVKLAVAQRQAGLAAALVADPDLSVRRCLAELLGKEPAAAPLLDRLQADAHPHVRAAALTQKLAAELVAQPGRETSWHVLRKAARLAKVPFWKLGPSQPWQPEKKAPPDDSGGYRGACAPRSPGVSRELAGGLRVAPLAISGHYGLPVAGFHQAVEAGVNLFFWEPSYHTMTEFMARLSSTDRRTLHVLSGSFEADGPRIQRDVERVLRLLHLEQLGVFLVFWVQNWRRITPDVRETLEKLRAAGKIGTFGLSTHVRALAVEAMQAGWNPIMVRHSAAHRGAEEQIFPRAAELGTSLITFNATCYGRLLQSVADEPVILAADCYRYSLCQPAVKACFSAPATIEQLRDNLTVIMEDIDLLPERKDALLARGVRVYREDTAFRMLVKSR